MTNHFLAVTSDNYEVGFLCWCCISAGAVGFHCWAVVVIALLLFRLCLCALGVWHLQLQIFPCAFVLVYV